MMGLEPGAVVGRYRVLRPAGEGGLAEVYLAEDLGSGRRVALKLWRAGPATRPVSPPQPHPNLVQFLEAGEWEGRPYQVFEWVDGADLAGYIRANGRPDLFTACRLGAQVAAGLAALHAAGLVHGDVKPRNIIVAAGDAGLTARLIDLGEPANPGQPVLATPLYAAPEVIAGGQPTPAADAYSLGVVLFELLTGVTPAGGSRSEPLRPASLNPAVPPGLNRLVARLTDPDPARRPPDLEEVAELLGRWATPDLTPTVPLRPTSRLRTARATGRRHLLRAALAGALVLMVLLLAGVRLTQLLQPSAPPAGEAAQAAPPPPVTVPAVARLPADRAAALLTETGLRPETRQTYSTVPAGLVVDQEPPAGTQVAPGTTVTLTVSAGPPPTQADDRHEPERGRGKKRGRDG